MTLTVVIQKKLISVKCDGLITKGIYIGDKL